MLLLYYGSGARDFEVVSGVLLESASAAHIGAAAALLEAMGEDEVADQLLTLPFKCFDATNHFGDEFSVLLASVPIPEYAHLAEAWTGDEAKRSFRVAAKALDEVGLSVRFIALAPEVSTSPKPVSIPAPLITSSTVERALREAQVLLENTGAASAIDRAHTSIHAYLKEVCSRGGLSVGKDPNVAELFKVLREQHPSFTNVSSHDGEIQRMLRAVATILDSSGTLRNRASGAHPNADILGEAEAILVINLVRSLLHYVDARTM